MSYRCSAIEAVLRPNADPGQPSGDLPPGNALLSSSTVSRGAGLPAYAPLGPRPLARADQDTPPTRPSWRRTTQAKDSPHPHRLHNVSAHPRRSCSEPRGAPVDPRRRQDLYSAGHHELDVHTGRYRECFLISSADSVSGPWWLVCTGLLYCARLHTGTSSAGTCRCGGSTATAGACGYE